ncbi:hypothetical protein BCR42DRAFT_427188 [Absidia repens]|uniref:Heterokaryon incompatibility domain-containing protein n=1 Tax=Absidia repens TaxID=90262 RepID=A0A1X2I1J3_9FUNG|nr:hypothetical protein BCR42DRAFT_427188 [Absidia repens]
MTKDNEVELLIEDNTQQPQKEKPFQIVLVDIEEAAKNHQIHCVEAPLEASSSEEDGEPLEYVALSYRWGELHETTIDTQLDYTASITSFDLKDFYKLCNMMTHETDLKSIKYVWVDAICVDQVNYERRKATIYQMTNIYERASYIVAVPDLHAAHLRNTLVKVDDIMNGTSRYCNDIYYLIHGNSDQLAIIEEKFLDDARVPNDPALRQWLKTYTDHFMDSFMKYKEHYVDYNPVEALDHLYEANHLRSASLPTFSHARCTDNDDDDDNDHGNGNADENSFKGLNHCDKVDCPLVFFDDDQEIRNFFRTNMWSGRNNSAWKQLICERSDSIRQSMEFFVDLIRDWSSRVWVISEFSIAKKKNNLKYWFIHMVPDYRLTIQKGFSFFKFDFDDLSHSTNNDSLFATTTDTAKTRTFSSNPVYLKLHYTMTRQLNQQTFLDMILKSKASKNEDRFYSILPVSEYKDKLVSKNEVHQWNISTLVSVKLKLFEWMNTKDKLNLLFWAGDTGSSNIGTTLPTFATSTLSLTFPGDCLLTDDRFDVSDKSIVTLHQTTNNKKMDEPMFYLHLETNGYSTMDDPELWFAFNGDFEIKRRLFERRFGIDDPIDSLDVVCITTGYTRVVDNGSGVIFLIGSIAKNIWILDGRRSVGFSYSSGWSDHKNENGCTGFDIY